MVHLFTRNYRWSEGRGGRLLGADVIAGCGTNVVLGSELGHSERTTDGHLSSCIISPAPSNTHF